MSDFSIFEYGLGIFQALLIIVLSPLIVGIMRKIKAKSQKRIGSGIFQLYYDIIKLLKKDEVVSDQSSWLFRYTPWINFVSIASAAFFIPVFLVYSPFGVVGDILFVVGLFALGRFFTMLAGLDVASSFGGLGSSREMMVSALLEPVLFMTIFVIALFYGGTNISTIVTSANDTSILIVPGVLFAMIAFFIIMMAETGKIPFDNPSTHLELTMIHESMVLEYSGKNLALMEWSHAIKQMILFALFVDIFFTWNFVEQISLVGISIGILFFIAKVSALASFTAFIETRVAKWRLFRVSDLIAMAISSSMIGVIFFFL
ncbi:respiratory chain complex I subunit 1 family protein [Nitrosarchaeum koreense]|uniref:Hydrogenase, membrane subunit 3-like protein (EchB-like) n=1 Tax=Nitrosarchaeum koreense MY1 TaxID=1001994 RepID=F9CW28_9ARCH|nr:NADH-quinone oxidoreductase subunit H [Nitrosarchaeum koreense]EGP93480.1 Hydrogenase, membrane subunit 3-like protein (EchB-like) [Nitrosarchaeum koreense MY1]